jgi:hypothetical protein
MAKKAVKYKSFRLAPPHKYTRGQVILYVSIAVAFGLIMGWLLKDQYIAAVSAVSVISY